MLLHVITAMHGFCPPHTTESLASFALYYASPFIARYDANKKQYREATISTIIQKTTLYVRGLLLTGIIHSLFLAYPDAFIEIGSSFDRDQWYHWRTIFKWRRLWENLCFAGSYCDFFFVFLFHCTYSMKHRHCCEMATV